MNKKNNNIRAHDGAGAERDGQNMQRVRRLIDALIEGGLDPSARRMLDQWFASPASEDEKSRVIADMLYREISANDHRDVAPDKETRRRFAELAEKLGLPANGKPAMELARKRPLGRRIVWRAAAVVIPFVAVLGAGYFAGWFGGRGDAPGVPATVAQVTAPVIVESIEGVQKDAWLPDSSRVWMNSGSRVEFGRNEKNERIAELTGEAYFAVRREEGGAPFIVHTEHLDVRVLGTEFNVKAYRDDDMTGVTLYEGSVEVSCGDKTQRLVPGQTLTCLHATGEMRVAEMDGDTAAGRSMDWRSDAIFANEKPVAEILRMIGNAYDYELALDTPISAGTRYSISFDRTQPVENVLRALVDVSGGGFSYEIKNDTIIIYSRNRE